MSKQRNPIAEESDLPNDPNQGEGIVINEVQLLLAEKRTSLATMRTGIAVLVLPLSVLSFLITFSKHYELLEVMPFLGPLLALCLGLACLGVYLVYRSLKHLHRIDQHILDLKKVNRQVGQLLD